MTEQTTDSTPGNAKKLKQLTQFLHRLYYTLINKSKFKCPFWREYPKCTSRKPKPKTTNAI